MTRTVRLFASAVVLAFALAACADAAPPATVAGTPVTDEELTRAAAVFQGLADAQQAPCGDQADVRESDPPEAACNRFSLGVLIQIRLAEAYAAAHDVTVDEAVVTETADRFSESLGEGVLDGALEAAGATREDLLEIVRGSLLLDEVALAIALDEAGEDELRETYEANPADYTVIQVDHILVETEEEADAIYEQVTAPGFTEEDFQALAKEVSIDPSAAQNSGSLGTNPATNFVEPFANAAVALEPGEVSEPVQTDFGWHVIWMVDKEVTPFEEARDQLLADRQGAAFADHVRAADADGEIEVDPSFGRFDAQALTVVAIRSTDPGATTSPTPVNATPSG